MTDYLLALDQGTTSSRSALFDRAGNLVGIAQAEFPQIFPAPGHVEHDPEAIWHSQWQTARSVLNRTGVSPRQVAAVGITNQRETTVLWDRETGQPVANAIVWQSRITAPICERLKKAGHEPLVQAKTGLRIDPYFSATKIRHLLDTVPGLEKRAERGEIAFGTVDTFLAWRLSGGRLHITDASNASRTMLFDIHTGAWDDELLRLFGVPRAVLPEVRDSSEVYGLTDPAVLGRAVPLAGIAGDQQAATFGQTCFEPGSAKNTYGTGCFMLLNTGREAVASRHGLLTTVAWRCGGKLTYALEGSVFIAGAAVQWLRDGLRLIEDSAEVEALARSVPDNGGLYFVPAFVGLGTPHWDASARGLMIGLTRGTTAGHVARATLEALAFQSADVLASMQSDARVPLASLRVDGGATSNGLLMQIQSDLLGLPLERPAVQETTALGAAYLAGLAVGVWSGLDELAALPRPTTRWEPQLPTADRTRLLHHWHRAVDRCRSWDSSLPSDDGMARGDACTAALGPSGS